MRFLLVSVLMAAAQPEVLVIDAPMGKPDHLYNFRKLLDLKISGSSQFSELGLKSVKARIPAQRVTIVDLRQESHGFAGGLPVSWEAFSAVPREGKRRPARAVEGGPSIQGLPRLKNGRSASIILK